MFGRLGVDAGLINQAFDPQGIVPDLQHNLGLASARTHYEKDDAPIRLIGVGGMEDVDVLEAILKAKNFLKLVVHADENDLLFKPRNMFIHELAMRVVRWQIVLMIRPTNLSRGVEPFQKIFDARVPQVHSGIIKAKRLKVNYTFR